MRKEELKYIRENYFKKDSYKSSFKKRTILVVEFFDHGFNIQRQPHIKNVKLRLLGLKLLGLIL